MSNRYNAYLYIGSDQEMEDYAAANGLKGDGSFGNPFIIEDLDINGSGYYYGIRIEDVDHHFIVRNNKVHDVYYSNPSYLASGGIFLSDTPNAVLEGNEISNNTECGISVFRSGVRIFNNTIVDNRFPLEIERGHVTIENNTFLFIERRRGVRQEYGEAIIRNNTFNDLFGQVWGISLKSMDNYTVEGNTFKGCRGGIAGRGDRYNPSPFSVFKIEDNRIQARYTGIAVSDSDGASVKNNTITSVYHGIDVEGSNNVTFRNNTFNGVGFMTDGAIPASADFDGSNTVLGNPVMYLRDVDGKDVTEDFGQLVLYNCSNITVKDRVLDKRCSGFMISRSWNVTVTNLTMGNRVRSTVHIVESQNIMFSNNDDINYARCTVDESTDIELTENRFNCTILTLKDGTGYEIINNSMTETPTYGPVIARINDCTIQGNQISITNRTISSYGMRLQRCLRLEIKNNSMEGEGILFYSTGNLDGWNSHDMDDSNTFEGRPIVFRKDSHGARVTGRPGQVIIVNCTAFDIRGCDLSNGSFGVTVAFSRYGNVTYNSFEGVRWPSLWLFDSYGTRVTNNEIVNSSGMIVEECWYTKVVGNLISSRDMLDTWGRGVYNYDSRNTTVKNNMLKDVYGDGIRSYGGLYGDFSHNHLENCTMYGVSIDDDGNSVHHNNLIDNNVSSISGRLEGPQSLDRGSSNSWTNGTEGNYWSDYVARYPGANNDGTVWSLPYELESGASDPHPLVKRSGLLPLTVAVNGTSLDQEGTASLEAEVMNAVGRYNVSWRFEYGGENLTQYGLDFEHEFNITGYYKVNVTLTDGAGRSTRRMVNVTVRDSIFPVADAGSDILIDQGMIAELNGTRSSDNIGITRWLWSVEHPDGVMGFVTPTVKLRYDEVGEYVAVLEVWDEFNNNATDSITITVLDAQDPIAIAGPDIVIDQGDMAELNGSESFDRFGIARWMWTVEHPDGNLNFTTPAVNLTYDVVGVYRATLTVWDFTNNTGTDTLTITVRDAEPPQVVLGGPVEVMPGDTVEFDGTLCTDNVGITSWVWSFIYEGHVRDLEGATQSWTFDVKGAYYVTLTVTDAVGNEANGTFQVLVGEDIPPIAIAGDDVTVEPGETVTLDGRASTDDEGITSWVWTFDHGGEQQRLTGSVVQFVFEESGLFTVTLTVTDPSENVGMATMRVIVVDTERPVAVAGEDIHVDLDDRVQFDGSGSIDKVGITSYEWTFEYEGRTIVLEGVGPSYTFEVVGTFEVTLRVSDADGNTDSTTQMVHVHDDVPPEATIRGPENATVGKPTELDGSTSTDNIGISNWTWTIELADETIHLFGEKVEYTFGAPGNFTVTLDVRDDEGLTGTHSYIIGIAEMDGGNGGGGDNGGDDGGDNGDDDGPSAVLVGGLFAIVVVVIAAISIVLRKRSSKGEGDDG